MHPTADEAASKLSTDDPNDALLAGNALAVEAQPAVRQIAAKLVQLYAARASAPGRLGNTPDGPGARPIRR